MQTISIITPSYNQGAFIEATIQSVLNQRIPAIEYLIMDGGSTDETLAILQKYQDQLRWVSEKDEGQAHAVNKGLQQATGEIIGWLNSDDIYYPDAINKVCKIFAEHPGIDLIYGDAWQIDRYGNILEKYPTEPWKTSRLKLHCFLSQPAVFFRKSVIEKFGFLDKSLQFCMDYEYWLRLGLNGAKVYYLPEVLAGSRIYPETKSSRFYLQAHLEAMTMLQKSLGYIPAEWLVNYSSAKVKVERGHDIPPVKLAAATWLNIWKAAGIYNQGRARVAVWLKAQFAMLKKIFAKLITV